MASIERKRPGVSESSDIEHARSGAPERFAFGGLILDTGSRTATGPAGSIRLTPRECDLLACMMREPGSPFSRERLLREAWRWDNAHQIRTKTVDMHIRRLRGKLEEIGCDPNMVQTVRYEGYRLAPTR